MKIKCLVVFAIMLNVNALWAKPRPVVQVGHSGQVNSVSYSPKGRFLASGSDDHTVKIWEVERSYVFWTTPRDRLLRTLYGHTDAINSVSYAPNGKQVASGSDDKTIKIWEVESGRLLKTLHGHTDDVNSVKFSPDSKTLASGSSDKTVKIWEAASGRLLKTLRGHNEGVKRVNYSPDGKQIASGTTSEIKGKQIIKIWDVGSGRLIKTLKDPLFLTDQNRIFYYSSNKVSYSPDGRQLATFNKGSTIGIIKNEEVSKRFSSIKKTARSRFYSVSYSPSGKTLAAGSSGSIQIFDVNSGDLLKVLGNNYEVSHGKNLNFIRHYYDVVNSKSFSYSPDSKKLASSLADKTVTIWDMESGRLIKTMTGKPSSLWSSSHSPNARKMALKSKHSTVKIVDVDSGEEAANMFFFKDSAYSFQKNSEWVTLTKEGYYVASSGGEKFINIVDGMKVWTVEEYGDEFNRPDLVKAALQQRLPSQVVASQQPSPPKESLPSQVVASQQPSPPQESEPWTPFIAQSIAQGKTKVVSPEELKKIIGSYPVDTTPPQIVLLSNKIRGPIKQLVHHVNTSHYHLQGQAIDESGISSVSVNGGSVRFNKKGRFFSQLSLSPGINEFRIVATDNYSNQAAKTFVINYNDRPPFGHYYALVIGINDYKHFTDYSTLKDLDTPENDAREIARILRQDYRFRVRLLLGQEATYHGILQAIEQITLRDVQRGDHLLIYYAGHGEKKAGRAYWLPVDAQRRSSSKWISADKVTGFINRSAANNILLVSDSCYSGLMAHSLADNRKFRGIPRQKYLRTMLGKRSRILITSGGDTPVADFGGRGHSVFAQAFIDALKAKRFEPFIAYDLFRYIQERVIEEFGDEQVPAIYDIRNAGHKGGDFVFQMHR